MEGHEIRIEVFGAPVAVSRDDVAALREAAAEHAGVSSRHRDLSLVLNRALDSGSMSLSSRPELAALLSLVEESPERFAVVGDELEQAARRATG
jgi:hypothetical protein